MTPAISIYMDAGTLAPACLRVGRLPDYDKIIRTIGDHAASMSGVDEYDLVEVKLYLITASRSLGLIRKLQDQGITVSHRVRRGARDDFNWRVQMAVDIVTGKPADVIYVVGGGHHMRPTEQHRPEDFIAVGFPGTISGVWEQALEINLDQHSFVVG